MKLKETMYTIEDCEPNGMDKDFTGKVFVLRPTALGNQYQKPEFQLWKGASGFGCKPDTVGNGVFGTCLADGEYAKWSRQQVLGVLKDELIPTEGVYNE